MATRADSSRVLLPYGLVVISFLLLGSFAAQAAAQEITAEKLAEFLPETLAGADRWRDAANSHLEIPGQQKASTTQYYLGEPAGTVQIIHYAPDWEVYEKAVERTAGDAERRARTGGSEETIAVDGFEAFLVAESKLTFVLVHVGDAIMVRLEVKAGGAGEVVVAAAAAMDLQGLADLPH